MTKKTVRIYDVAKAAGVSEATVSLALNHSPFVKQETRKAVEAAARKLGYTPNPYARRLVLQKSGMIGVVVPDIENVYYAALVKTLSAQIADSGYSLSIFISDNDPERERRAIRDMIGARVEGIVYVPINTPCDLSASRALLQSGGIPTVCATTQADGLPSVRCDLAAGMRALVAYLAAAGYRSLHYLTGPAGVYALDIRADALIQAAADAGLPRGSVTVQHLAAVDYDCACAAVAPRLGDLPDCFVCANDFMALGVVNTLTAHGIAVPQQTAVAGFDNSIFSRISPVPITTVHQDIPELARRTVRCLLHQIRPDSTEPPDSLCVPVQLIPRASTIRV